MAQRVTVVDYGLGNLYSVTRALERVGAQAAATSDGDEIRRANRLVVPGVGAFGDGMAGLRERGLLEPIREFAAQGRPILGICLGAQLFMESGREFGVHEGLGLLEGDVRGFEAQTQAPAAKIPHVGWNLLRFEEDRGAQGRGILNGVPPDEFVYFTHSYVIRARQPKDVVAVTEYAGQVITAVVQHENVYGCQFHPEKSGLCGLQILRNFLEV